MRDKNEDPPRKRCSMGIGMLNLNGLTTRGMLEVEEAMNKKDLDIFCLLETKLVKEDIKEIELNGFEVFEQRREKANKDKKGGGLGIMVRKKSGVLVKRWSPSIQDPALHYVQKERMWITYETPGGKTAVCCTYLGYQNPHTDENGPWNDGVYSVLGDEIFQLRGKGFRIVLKGDFNAWIGNDLEKGGIPGNRRKINKNGERFLNFLDLNNMVNINGACRVVGDWSTRIATGLWTRHAPDYSSSSILDFAVISAEHQEGVLSMEIDEAGLLGGASDHNMVITRIVDIFVMVNPTTRSTPRETRWNIAEDQDWTEFKTVVNKEIEKIKDDGTSESLSNELSRAVTTALVESIGRKAPPTSLEKKRFPRYIVDIMNECKQLEKIWKTEKSAFATSAERTPPNSLLVASQAVYEKKEELDDAMKRFGKEKRKPIMKLCKMKTKRSIQVFWSYVSRRTKKTTDLEALQCKRTGVLMTKPEDVAEEVLSYLKDIFSGEHLTEGNGMMEEGDEGEADEVREEEEVGGGDEDEMVTGLRLESVDSSAKV